MKVKQPELLRQFTVRLSLCCRLEFIDAKDIERQLFVEGFRCATPHLVQEVFFKALLRCVHPLARR